MLSLFPKDTEERDNCFRRFPLHREQKGEIFSLSSQRIREGRKKVFKEGKILIYYLPMKTRATKVC
jgi:hypothetical protein